MGFGGTQGWGFNLPGDDIAVGAMADYGQPAGVLFTPQATTLHKYTYVLGNDSSSLYVYMDSAFSPEYSTTQYQATTPIASATLGTAVLTGTALTSLTVTSGGNYSGATAGGNVAIGQQTFAPPTITVDPAGTACSVKPTVTAVYGLVNYVQTVASVAINTPGTCQSVPTVTLQTQWTTPYRLAPTTVTEKIVDPANGSSSSGYLLTDAVDATKWPSGSAVEIAGWPHDDAAVNESFGKYFTGSSKHFGFHRFTEFQGNWAGPDTLVGVTNTTDGHKYYADATHPMGPGVAYETPPDFSGAGGDYNIFHHFYLPPSDAVIYIGCSQAPGGHVIYHPCLDGVLKPYNLFHFHSDVGGGFDQLVTFNPADGTIGFPGPITAPAINVVNASATNLTATHVLLGDGNQGAYSPQTTAAIITPANTTVFNGYLGAMIGLGFCNSGQVPTLSSSCVFLGGLQAALDLARSYYTAVDIVIASHNNGTIGNRVSVARAWEDGMIALNGTSPCTNFEMLCDGVNNNWGVDPSGNWRQKTLKLTSATPSCSSTQGGTFNYIAGAAGSKDTVQVCAKDATNAFAWRTLY